MAADCRRLPATYIATRECTGRARSAMSRFDLRRSALRWPFAVLAYACVALGVVGVVLPGLPTVPFLLVAAWAAARGSDRLSAWLDDHRQFGPLLRDWREQRAIPRRAKWTGVVLLLLSWSVIALRGDAPGLALITGVVFCAMAAFLLSRPVPRVRASGEGGQK